MEFHGGISEENPGAPNIAVSCITLGAEDHEANWIVRMRGHFMEKRQVHGGLRGSVGKSRRSPNGDRAPAGGQNQGLGKTLRVDVLERSVETIDEQIDREASAIREGGCIRSVEQIGEGPLLFRAVTVVVDQQRAIIESSKDLGVCRRRINTVCQYLGCLQG